MPSLSELRPERRPAAAAVPVFESRQHLDALDGLRGLAILMVFAFHTFSGVSQTAGVRPLSFAYGSQIVYAACQFGWTGVDLFFVLSGFLITGILLDARGSERYFSVFYARRALRIFPVYYIAVVLVFAVLPALRVGAGEGVRWQLFGTQMWWWLNLSNLKTAFQPDVVPPLSHFWTLAIEEQFYLVWPLLVRFLPARALRIVCIAGLLGSMLLRNLPAVQMWQQQHNNVIYRLTPFHADGLFAGALLALLVRGAVPAAALVRAGRAAVVLGLCAAALLWNGAWPDRVAVTRFGYSAFVLLYSGVVLLCVASHRGWTATLFRVPALRSLGRYSYCIYVIHIAVLGMLGDLGLQLPLGQMPPSLQHTVNRVVFSGLALLFCYGVARLSWAVIEEPALRLKRHFRYGKASMAASPMT